MQIAAVSTCVAGRLVRDEAREGAAVGRERWGQQRVSVQTAAVSTCVAGRVVRDEARGGGSGGEREMEIPPAQRVIWSRSEA